MVQHRKAKKIPITERRRFLRAALKLLAGAALPPLLPRPGWSFPGSAPPSRQESGSEFVFAQLVYEGGNWDPEPSAWPSLLKELEAATSIDARLQRVPLELRSPMLFSHPFLFMAGNDKFNKFSEDEVMILRKYLKSGGTLLADDCAALPGYGFDLSFREEMERTLPSSTLERLPSDHTVFRSFFMVRGMGGRRVAKPFLEGVSFGGRTPVIYSSNSLSSAWARDSYGRWVHDTTPGGERQRRLAFHLGINIIMYALCDDYKQDRIHIPFLRQKI